MNKLLVIMAGLFVLAGNAFADGKSCDELKSEIDAKLQANHVTGYSLEIVDKGSEADKKVVGTCEAGSKDIVYSRQ